MDQLSLSRTWRFSCLETYSNFFYYEEIHGRALEKNRKESRLLAPLVAIREGSYFLSFSIQVDPI